MSFAERISQMGVRLGTPVLAAAIIAVSMGVAPVAAQPAEGEIVIVQSSEPPNIDPGNFDYSQTGPILRQNVIETLTLLDLSDSSLQPRLATAWEQVDDTTYRYTLREGVTFHDGAPFNADAVVYSVERLFNTDLEQIARNKYWDHMTFTAEAIDEYTVEFSLSQAEPVFDTRLSQVPIVSPNTPFDALTRAPVGTGPYTLAEWQAGVQIVLERNPDYWGDQPEVERATFVFRGEGSVRASMVEVGEADFTFSVPEELATTDMDVAYQNFETIYFILGAWEAPLDDLRVRMAVNLAIDREALLGTILPAETVLGTAIIGPSISGSNPDLVPHPYDPGRVTELLEEARADGVDVDREITVMYINERFPGSNELVEAMALMLQAAGFNARMELVESGVYREYRDEPRGEDRAVILLSRHDNDKGDAGFSLTRHLCDSNRNPICLPELDEMIQTALATPQGPEREAAWQEVVRFMHEDVQVDAVIGHQVAFARIGPRISYDVSGKNPSTFLIEEVTFN
ncbi:ABC transporter substrate-binding protein [Alterinioella nitratireducens]|uniref:ABC transporter substrate-binding protein n=1 Tax=Alterinioella nitratireducens TaxID=2735915 RepID=UPI0040580CDA